MNNKSILPLLLLLLCSISNLALAGGPPSIPATFLDDERTDNKFFVGLNWELGASMVPQGVIGYRHAKVDSSGNVDGASLSFSFLFSKFQPASLKALYFDGKENLQGELGFGYDFRKQGMMGVLGLQSQYLNLGTDYLPGSGFRPYAGINSIGGYNKPDKTPSCSAGFSFNAVTGVCDNDVS